MESPLRVIAGLFHAHRRFVLTTHVNPDGDAIGSEAALCDALRSAGKTVTVINHSPTPVVYDFLDPNRDFLRYDESRDRELLLGADVIAVLDTNQTERLRSMEASVLASRAIKVCIDHHLNPQQFADHTFFDTEAASTGELIYHLILEFSGGIISPTAAAALYTAIMTDTGSFRYPRVNSGTFRLVADLIDRGADPVTLYEKVYERWSGGRLRLLGEMLATLTIAEEGSIVAAAISREMLRRTGTTDEDTDNFTSYLMSLNGVRVGILLLEQVDAIKISFRSRGPIPINELAREFGGNGHLNAAGATVQASGLASIEATVLKAARKYIR